MTLLDYRMEVRDLIARFLPCCTKGLPCLRQPQEPDYTAALAIGLAKLLDEDSKTKKLGLRFGGCYIHQKPYVTYDDNPYAKTCELGDLLVLCREKRNGKELINATIFQLKMGENKGDVDEKQLRLYSEWPQFWFGRSEQSDGKRVYNVYPKLEMQGALYSFAYRPESSDAEECLRFTVAMPRQCSVSKYVDGRDGVLLQDFLADFIIGLTGRSISSEKGKDEDGDDWSVLIRETVEQIKGKIIRRNGLLTDPAQSRTQGNLFLNLIGSGSLAKEAAMSEKKDFLIGGMGVLVISKSEELDAEVYERLTTKDIEKRLKRLGYEQGATALEYKICTETGSSHTVRLNKYKQSYTHAEVKSLLNEMGCFAEDFWREDLPQTEWFIKMDLAEGVKDEKGDDHPEPSCAK